MYFRRTQALALAVALIGSATVSAAAQRQEKDRLSREERQEAQAIVKLLEEAMAGKPAPADFPIEWHNDFLKAQQGQSYVPFMLNLAQHKFSAPTIAMYLRVVAKQDAPPAEEKDEKRDRRDKEDPAYAFEDVHFIDVQPPPAGEPYRIGRAFAVPGGEYDVYVLLREYYGRSKPAAPPKMALLKQAITVPDYWSGELSTSTVILADRVEPLTAPVPQDRQGENPYTLGNTRIVPAVDTRFDKKDELSLLFLVYNAQLKGTKPDITVEYSFHQKTPEGEKYFNKTNPQAFNEETLPPQFDLAAGHQLVAGQSVPLATFPEGDYRLEIKVSDNASGKSLTRDVLFTVVGS